MKKWFICMCMILIFLFTACDMLGKDSSNTVSTGIRVKNESTYLDIWYVYISESTSLSWGDDRLGASEVIMEGRSRSFGLNPGTYDIQVWFENESYGELYDITVDSNQIREVTMTNSIISVAALRNNNLEVLSKPVEESPSLFSSKSEK